MSLNLPLENLPTALADGLAKILSGHVVLATAGTDYVSPSGSYADPSWITSLAGSKITGSISGSISGANVTGNITGSAANVTGVVALAHGGTGVDLSATGGTGKVVKQSTLGGAFTVAALVAADIPDLSATYSTTSATTSAIGAAMATAVLLTGTQTIAGTKTFQANTVVGSGAGGVNLGINGAVGGSMDLAYRSSGVDRWYVRMDGTAETGSNAGNNFLLIARTDAGTFLGTWMAVNRASGLVTFGSSSISQSGAGTFTSLASPVINGGSSSGSDVTLSSTSHATKGRVYLNGTTVYVDASGTLAGGSATFTAITAGNATISAGITSATATIGGATGKSATLTLNGSSLSLIGTDTATDATGKGFRVGMLGYSNAALPGAVLSASNSASQIFVGIGGGTSLMNAATQVILYTAANNTTPTGTERMRVDTGGNVSVGIAALATTATDGFLYIPTCPGTPTGTPTAKAGLSPIIVDSANNKLCVYVNGAWKSVTLA